MSRDTQPAARQSAYYLIITTELYVRLIAHKITADKITAAHEGFITRKCCYCLYSPHSITDQLENRANELTAAELNTSPISIVSYCHTCMTVLWTAINNMSTTWHLATMVKSTPITVYWIQLTCSMHVLSIVWYSQTFAVLYLRGSICCTYGGVFAVLTAAVFALLTGQYLRWS